MLSWLFKKRADAEAPAAPPPAVARAAAESKTRQIEDARTAWLPRLQSARGDDAALLLIAQTAPVLDIKLEAVEALESEAALKQAERTLRNLDSRVHRAAKRRWQAAVAQREARVAAQRVIDAASALRDEQPLAANRLVAIDRDWQAIDAALIEPAQVDTFIELHAQLNAVLHEQALQHEREQAQLKEQEQARLRAEAEAQARRVAEAQERAHLAALLPPEPEAAVAPPAAALRKGLDAAQRAQIELLLSQAEAALAEGQLGEAQPVLQAIDAAVAGLNGVAMPEGLRARYQALHAERGRLKAWQQWGGARALEALVDEAEALARLTLAAAEPEAPKLKIKAHADSIHALRLRWKEIDRLGAPSGQALWQRFDAALQTAHQPVAAQQAALKAVRQENLQAREALLATLDAMPVGELPSTPDELSAHWKEQLRALSAFQLAWRQLGPLEHTVPAAARSALQQRLDDSVARIESPLKEARRVAEAEREQFIVRTEALVQELARHPALRDAVPRVRELQADWQHHARTLPLARPVETALWVRFKAATDAVFAQREAAFNARDAELAANLAGREALLDRLTAIDLVHAPVADLQRALNDADREWRQAVEVPRAAVNGLETRFREARAALAQAVAENAHQRWRAECDALSARLALCEERESAAGDAQALAARWSALAALPPDWEKPLAQRWSQPPEPGPLAESACDDVLLQLESVFDMPASPESQAARRELKLRALKEALEGRAAAAPDPAAQRTQWLAAVLRQSGMTAVQRARLHALVAAMRNAPPGSPRVGGAAR